MTTGRKPYFSSRKPLTSSHPSSGERNFDGAGTGAAVAGSGLEGVSTVCAATDDAQSRQSHRQECVKLHSNAKIFFQSAFMSTTVQPRRVASSSALSSRPTCDCRSYAHSRAASV
jgi:hypothetical protein